MHVLALAVGRADVDRLRDELTTHQLEDWLAFYHLNPFGPGVDNWRAGMLAATMANLWTNGRRFTAADFLPGAGPRQENWRVLAGWFKAHAGKGD